MHAGLHAITHDWMASVALDRAEDGHTGAPLARAELAVGTVLFVASVAILGGFGLSELLLDPTAHTWVKVGMGLMAGSMAVFAVAALRWRLATAPHDPYNKVVR